jgi:sugar/nucleoside kinase (ribokinase family)
VFTECEGVIITWCSDNSFREKLRYYVGKAGVKTVSYKLLPTDATPAMMKGGRATSLMSFYKGLIRNYHWYTDTPEHVDPHNLERARELVLKLMVYSVFGG